MSARSSAPKVSRLARPSTGASIPRTGRTAKSSLDLVGEDPKLRREVGVHAPVAVEVVGRHVQQHGDLRGEPQRVLQLERGGLADDRRARAERRVAVRRRCGEQAERVADVAGDCDRSARLRDRSRPISSTVVVLPLVPVTATKRFCEQPPGQLELADHRDPPFARCGDHGRVGGDAGALDDAADARERELRVLHKLDAASLELRGPRAGRVAADHALAARRQRQRRRNPGARQPDDEVGAGGQRRAAHRIVCA